MQREMICISCPVGCHLTVTWHVQDVAADTDVEVAGNRCPRGEEYGKEEVRAPKRVVTATCAVNSELLARVPVKTDAPLLKEHIASLLNSLYAQTLRPPLHTGDIVMENIGGTGVNLVVTRSIER